MKKTWILPAIFHLLGSVVLTFAFTSADVETLLFKALDARDPAVREAVSKLKAAGVLEVRPGSILQAAYENGATEVVQAANVLRSAGLLALDAPVTPPATPPAPAKPAPLTFSEATQLVLSAISEVGSDVGYPTRNVESSHQSGSTAFIQVKRNGWGPFSRPFVFEVDLNERKITRVYQIDVWGNPIDDWSHVYSGRGTP